jgi:5-hydroxyisourate hydrolase
MSAITTHVLDTSRGRPAAGVPVVLEQSAGDDRWRAIGRGETDADGRLGGLMSNTAAPMPGVYRLVFDTQRYFQILGVRTFYPRVIVVFETTPGETHYHVPLLVGPFGYTTYRGS